MKTSCQVSDGGGTVKVLESGGPAPPAYGVVVVLLGGSLMMEAALLWSMHCGEDAGPGETCWVSVVMSGRTQQPERSSAAVWCVQRSSLM